MKSIIIKNKRIFRIILTLIIVIAFALFIKSNLSDFRVVKSLTFIDLLYISLLTLLTFLINGMGFKVIMSLGKVKLKTGEWFGLILINRMLNYLLLRAGPIALGRYLKNRYDLPYQSFISISLFSIALRIATLSFIGVILAWFLAREHDNILLHIFFSIFLLSIILVYLLLYKSEALKKIKIITNLHKSLSWVKNSKPLNISMQIIFLILISLIVNSFKLYYIYYSLSLSISFVQAALITCSGLLSFFINITPAALGIRELVMAATAAASSLSLEEAAVAATLDRLITIFWIFALGPVFSYFLFKSNGKN